MWNRFTERPKNRDALCITALVSFALCVFWKTLFLGQSISHIYLTAQRDVLFRQFYSPLDPGYDESLYLMHIPFLHLVVDFWRHLQLPLWNPYGGFGTPLIGDITARPFSLLKIPFLLFPSIYTLNATLIFELTLAAVGTYVLTGALSLPRYARVFAALAYFLCPYLLRNSELNIGTSASLLPFVMWTFVWLANKPNIKRAILAAVSTAVFISIGHAITSFNDIAFSALVALLVFATKDGRTLGLRVAEGGKWIALVAGLSICFSAPVLLTFI